MDENEKHLVLVGKHTFRYEDMRPWTRITKVWSDGSFTGADYSVRKGEKEICRLMKEHQNDPRVRIMYIW